MATILLKLTTYDPRVLAALEDLRRSRKQSMFVLEALRHYLENDAGRETLVEMTGNCARESCRQKPQSVQEEKPAIGKIMSVGDIFR
jgi:hypothetical protein